MFGLSQYKVLFMTEILFVEIFFFFRLGKRTKFPLRLAIGIIVCYLVAFFYPVGKSSEYSGWLTSLMFIVLFGMSYITFLVSFNVSWSTAFFCCKASGR